MPIGNSAIEVENRSVSATHRPDNRTAVETDDHPILSVRTRTFRRPGRWESGASEMTPAADLAFALNWAPPQGVGSQKIDNSELEGIVGYAHPTIELISKGGGWANTVRPYKTLAV
jgi:hypothetical protein